MKLGKVVIAVLATAFLVMSNIRMTETLAKENSTRIELLIPKVEMNTQSINLIKQEMGQNSKEHQEIQRDIEYMRDKLDAIVDILMQDRRK